MESRVDYQINYSEGRLIFWKPVSQIAESDSIISSQLLDGNPVYVVVDYEYETKDKYDERNYGLRAQQSLTDYLRVGGTYVREEQLGKNYILKGTDTVIHLGKDIKLTGEYAESESQSLGSFISTDGGLNFTELATGNADRGKAYGLKGEGYLFGRLGLTGYYKQIEKGFSSAATTSQQGKELMGAGATLDITPKTRLKVSHDIQKLLDDGNPQTQAQVGATKTETTSAQLQHEVITDKLKLTAEYRKQQVKEKKEQFASETNTETDIVAVKADYEVTQKTALSLEQQATLKGSPNQQTSLGVVHKPNEWLSLRGKETVGNQGSATSVGASANVKDKFELSGDVSRANAITGEINDTASLSGKAKVNEKTQVYTTAAVTDSSQGGQTQSLIFGTERKVNEELKLASSKTYARSGDKLTQANTYGLTKEKDGKKLEGTLTTQHSKDDTGVSNTNIFGLSGDINDKWAAQGSFERGLVQNHDGTQATRYAGAIGLGFVDKDKETGEVKLKASSKFEVRLDNGQEDKRQYLVYNAIEGKINPNTTLFAKANLSQTKNTTTKSTEAQYKELSTGLAYRPINSDRLNLLGRYTYLEDNSPSGQTDFKDTEKEKSHTLAGEAVYDLTDKWQLVEKLALKLGEEKVSGFEFTKTQTWLAIQRVNYNFARDWQVGAEYRRLTQKQAKDYKQGALVEVARKVGEFVQIGLGYNFTNFNDDLTHLNYTAQGPFVRLTGKFYDRTPEEIERARQKWLEQMIKFWAWELVNEELAKPDSAIMQELYKYFYLAENLRAEGRLKESEALFEKILQIGNIMYQEAEVYVRNRIELEKSIKENNRLALAYYKEGKLQEAKALWEKLLKEAEPVPIDLKF
jgi:tetratricopeptide (TPR) repeat protein